MAMEEEAYLLPQMKKVSSGGGAVQDCRLHVAWGPKQAREHSAARGSPLRNWPADGPRGRRTA